MAMRFCDFAVRQVSARAALIASPVHTQTNRKKKMSSCLIKSPSRGNNEEQ